MDKKDFLSWKIGDVDNHGMKISCIHTAEKEYIIYESEENILHYDDDSKDDLTKKLIVLSKEVSVIGILANEEDIKLVNCQLALAWRDCFNGNPEMAKTILNNLINVLNSKNKISYILSVLYSFSGVLIVGLLMIHLLKFHSFYDELNLVIKIFILGAFGGLISVLTKMKDFILDPESKYINILSGVSRIIISGAASLIFYLCYKSEMIFSFFNGNLNKANEIYFLLLFSFFMGFSERFIPEFSNKINNLMKEK